MKIIDMRIDMNTRQWANPEQLFDVFVTLSYTPGDSKDVKIDSIIPDNYDSQDILNQIPKFSYPCKYDSPGVEHYTFVLTDVEAKFHYGFCRFSHDQHHIICLLSRLPWFDVFYLLLNKISELSASVDGERQVRELLDAVYTCKVPGASEPCTVLSGTDLEFKFDGPSADKLACIPQNRNLTEYYSALDYEKMITVFACMLNERRILITSRKLSKLTACCHAAASLLYPCYWQHLFIPVLPEAVIEFVLAPMPYIIGVQESLMPKVKAMDLDDAVIVNVDDGTFTSVHDDRSLLPSDCISTLKKALKPAAQDDSVTRAFLRCTVRVIGDYRNCLQYHKDGISFDEDLYIAAASSSSDRSWREILVKMQYFSQFIDDRLALLNSGHGFQDEFEAEMNRFSADKNDGTKYKEWLANMKKQGMKLKSKGQHRIVGISKKVQDRTKKAYKDLGVRLDKFRKEDYSIIDRGNSLYMHKDGGKMAAPRHLPAHPLRPARPPRPTTSKELSPTDTTSVTSPRRQSYNQALKYKPLSFSEDDLPKISSLMNDPDLQNLFHGKSVSSASLNRPTESKSISASLMSSSASASPIPPPRRKRGEHLLELSSSEDVNTGGLHNEGFADNFNPLADDQTDSTSAASQLSPPDPPQAAEGNSRSSINDLIGLDLSGNSAASTVQTGSIWSQSQPNYFVSGNTDGQPPVLPATNPFGAAFHPSTPAAPAHRDFMSASSSSPSLTSMASNGHGPAKPGPSRPPPPILKPKPLNAEAEVKDPLAELKW